MVLERLRERRPSCCLSHCIKGQAEDVQGCLTTRFDFVEWLSTLVQSGQVLSHDRVFDGIAIEVSMLFPCFLVLGWFLSCLLVFGRMDCQYSIRKDWCSWSSSLLHRCLTLLRNLSVTSNLLLMMSQSHFFAVVLSPLPQLQSSLLSSMLKTVPISSIHVNFKCAASMQYISIFHSRETLPLLQHAYIWSELHCRYRSHKSIRHQLKYYLLHSLYPGLNCIFHRLLARHTSASCSWLSPLFLFQAYPSWWSWSLSFASFASSIRFFCSDLRGLPGFPLILIGTSS